MAATSWQTQLRAPTYRSKRSRREERRRPRKQKAKPQWDDTSSDLTAYRPSSQELARRHDIHKPKSLSERTYLLQHQQKLFLEEKENMFIRKTSFQENVERKKAIIKEIFHNQEKELQNVLVETDRTMAEVKDIFGDDPLKFKAIPHVTTAPCIPADENGSILGLETKGPSRLTALSNSVMHHPALNDFSDNSDVDSGDDRTQDSFESKLDLNYYKNLLHREQNREYDDKPSSHPNAIRIQDYCNPKSIQDNRGDKQAIRELENSSVIVKPSIIMNISDSLSGNQDRNYSTEVLGGAPGTSELQGEKISSNKLLGRTTLQVQNPNGQISDTDSTKTHSDGDPQQDSNDNRFGKFQQMKQVLDVLEGELSTYEGNSKEAGTNTTSDVSSLFNVMAKLIKYFKQSEIHIEVERTMHENLLQEFEEQRTLIDALTGDLINTQQQNCTLQDEFERFKIKTSQELEQIKEELKTFHQMNSSSTEVENETVFAQKS